MSRHYHTMMTRSALLSTLLVLVSISTTVDAGGWTPVTTFSSPFNSHVLLNKATAGDCARPFGGSGGNNLFWTPEALGVSTSTATTLNSIRGTPYYFPVMFFFFFLDVRWIYKILTTNSGCWYQCKECGSLGLSNSDIYNDIDSRDLLQHLCSPRF